MQGTLKAIRSRLDSFYFSYTIACKLRFSLTLHLTMLTVFLLGLKVLQFPALFELKRDGVTLNSS